MLEIIINLNNLIIKNIIYKNNWSLFYIYIYISIYSYIKEVVKKRFYYLDFFYII